MEAKIRRTQDNLFVLGTSVIAFGLWNLIKFTVYFFFNSDDIKQAVDEKYFIFSIIVTWVMFFISFLLRCFIGISARAEGKGKRKSVLYLVFTGIIMSVYFLIIVFETFFFIFQLEHIFTMVVTLIIDITSFMFLLELMINSIRIRHLRREVSK
ncbi:MAG: hypothetical protein K6F88_04980 [Ruminococcus sp.]|nr:hypothetical protein [Ruminococcus sp.]